MNNGVGTEVLNRRRSEDIAGEKIIFKGLVIKIYPEK